MTFSQYGTTALAVQYWNGSTFADIPGASVSGNNHVWIKFNFGDVTTTRIRVHVTAALASFSRITEVEAYGH